MQSRKPRRSPACDGKGNFATGATLVTSPITLSGTKYTFNSGIDSYSVGDINGDGTGDLVYIATNFYGPNFAPGIFIAMGKGDGSFDAPTFMPTPPFVAPPDIDVNPTLNGVRLADMNHDGKLDLVYIYNTTSYNTHNASLGIAIQFGNGDGTFKTTSKLTQLFSGATAPNPGAYQLALIADINKDSNPDLFVLSGLSLNSPSLTLQTYLGNGDGTFSAPAGENIRLSIAIEVEGDCGAPGSHIKGLYRTDGGRVATGLKCAVSVAERGATFYRTEKARRGYVELSVSVEVGYSQARAIDVLPRITRDSGRFEGSVAIAKGDRYIQILE